MTAPSIESLDAVVRVCLTRFTEEAFASRWAGKEHDFVNLFVHGYLRPACHEAGLIEDPTQIGIEVGVPQPSSIGSRSAARKDVVIWPQPRMSCWDESYRPTRNPVAVMEWKVSRTGTFTGRNHDRAWLAAFTASQAGSVGFAVALDRSGKKFRLWVDRFPELAGQSPWLRIS